MQDTLEGSKTPHVGAQVATRVLESDGILHEPLPVEKDKEFKVSWGTLGNQDSIQPSPLPKEDSGR